MKVAIYGKSFDHDFLPFAKEVFEKLFSLEISVHVFRPFRDFMLKNFNYSPVVEGLFIESPDLPDGIDFMISMGGDGTILDTASLVGEKEIPIIGINSGRLGFLANISREEISTALDALIAGNFSYDERSLMEITKPANLFGSFNAALNEITIQKKDSTMITINVFLNNEFVNTYWADGLIISTPTGSTAYSLSVGGPIISPLSETFIISPIAPHNLTVRPLVVPDKHEIKLTINGRGKSFLLSMDSHSVELDSTTEIILKKSGTIVKLVKLNHQDFYSTLRNKLLWGLDKRN
jgi:NAD+ kinase